MRPTDRALCILAVVASLSAGTALAQQPQAPAAAPETSGGETLERGEAYYHLMRATFAARRGDVREAMSEIRRAVELRPGSADLQAESASLLWAMGRRAEAEKLARGALRLDEQQPTALKVLAELATFRAMSRAGDDKSRDEAIRLYEMLARGPEVDDETLRILANLRVQAGDLAAAVDTMRRLLERRPGDLRVVRMLGQMLREDGRDDEALSVLLGHLRRYGGEPTLTEQVSELARVTERWAAVEDACAARMENQPGASDVIALRGEALLHLGRFAEAAEMLESTRELGAGDPVLLFHLYTVYDALGRLADAADVAQELVVALPDNPGALTVLGQALARQRQLDDAIEALRSALTGFRGEASAAERRDRIRWRLAELYLDQQRIDEATRTLAELEEPDHPEALELVFRAALEADDAEAARRSLQALRTQQKQGLAALLEGELLVRGGKVAKARARFREAASLLGRPTWAAIAEVWLAADRAEEGERAARAWVAEEPDSANANFVLGSYLDRLGRFEEAELALERTIALDPAHANALNYLGYSLADRDRELERALGLIRRALELDRHNGAYLDSLGWVYYRMGRYAEAVVPLEQAARELPVDPTVLDHLGDVYRKLDRVDLAVATWRRALRAKPEDPEPIRAKIEQLRPGEARTRLPQSDADPGIR